MGDRPATEDEFLTAVGFTLVDLHAGYRQRWFDIGLDVQNLLDTTYASAQFATTSRIAGDPPSDAPPPAGTCTGNSRVALDDVGNFAGCEDVHFTPGYPLTLRLVATLFLD